MSKYFVYAPIGWIAGHLRYGHWEGEIEIPDDKLTDEEWVREAVREGCDLIVDDWEIDSYGDWKIAEMRKIDEE